MSVIRHSSLFHRQVSRNGRTELFRNFGTFEKILFIGRDKTAQTVKPALEENLFDVHTAQRGATALQAILENDFAVVICDTSVPNFPFDTFYVAVERIRPTVLGRFLFLIDEDTDPRVIEFIERIDGLKVWRPIELNELFQMIEIVLGQNAVAAMT